MLSLQQALKYDPDNKELREHYKVVFFFLLKLYISYTLAALQGNRQGLEGSLKCDVGEPPRGLRKCRSWRGGT